MRMIILSAGQGTRLLPLTNDRPKCLLPVGGKEMLRWQLEAAAACGIEHVTVVTGFKSDAVERAIGRFDLRGMPVDTIFNPFYNVSDNLASCWLARDLMHDDFIIANGDTFFETRLLHQVMERAAAPINVSVDFKDDYDSDDMKVELDGDRVLAVSKTLTEDRTHAESIGLIAFHKPGGALFRAEVERAMRDGDGMRAWYLQAISRLASQGHVEAVSIEGLEWAEMDTPEDLEAVSQLAGQVRHPIRAVYG